MLALKRWEHFGLTMASSNELEGLCSCSPKPPGKNLPAVRLNSTSFRRRNTQNTRAMVIQKCELCCWSFSGRLPDIETAC
jgi:hypothetical protein